MSIYYVKKLFLPLLIALTCIMGTHGVGYGGDIIKGKVIYEEHCVACHGAEGHPFLQGVPDFMKGERLDKDNKELMKSIKDGHPPLHGAPPMNAMKYQLSDDAIEDVLTYIRILKK